MLWQFGTEQNPLRCSALDLLNKCPMQKVLLYLGEADGTTREAAETGSLAHAGIAAYHRAGGQVEAGQQAMADCLDQFPLASPAEAERHFADYCQDPRNQEADIVLIEQPVRIVLPAAASDPTGQDIVVTGTLDQVRRHEGQLMVFDIKTGSIPGWVMLHDYLFQICGYAIGASKLLGEPVLPGALIRTTSYRRKEVNEEAFWFFNLTLEQCHRFMAQLREEVARIRKGEIRIGPGAHCGFCPLGGIWNCTDTAKKYF